MSIKKDIFLWKNCPINQILILIASNYKDEIKLHFLEEINSSDKKKILSFSPTKTFPLIKEGDTFISGTLPILKYILNIHPEIKEIYMGTTLKNESSCEMWLNFISNNIIPIVTEINSQLEGEKPFNNETFEVAINDLIKELSTLNEYLKFKTFLTAHSVQICDLFLGILLVQVYNKVLTKDLREKIPNVIRHLKYIGNLDMVNNITGKLKECEKRAEPKPYVEKKEDENENEERQKSKKELKKEKKKEYQKEHKGEKKEKKENKKDKKKEEKKEETKEESSENKP